MTTTTSTTTTTTNTTTATTTTTTTTTATTTTTTTTFFAVANLTRLTFCIASFVLAWNTMIFDGGLYFVLFFFFLRLFVANIFHCLFCC